MERSQAPEPYEIVDWLRQGAHPLAPQVQPNAIATGRNPENAVVCVARRLMRLTSREELEAVIYSSLMSDD